MIFPTLYPWKASLSGSHDDGVCLPQATHIAHLQATEQPCCVAQFEIMAPFVKVFAKLGIKCVNSISDELHLLKTHLRFIVFFIPLEVIIQLPAISIVYEALVLNKIKQKQTKQLPCDPLLLLLYKPLANAESII